MHLLPYLQSNVAFLDLDGLHPMSNVSWIPSLSIRIRTVWLSVAPPAYRRGHMFLSVHGAALTCVMHACRKNADNVGGSTRALSFTSRPSRNLLMSPQAMARTIEDSVLRVSGLPSSPLPPSRVLSIEHSVISWPSSSLLASLPLKRPCPQGARH